MSGKFIVVDGLDGVGKSTLVKKLRLDLKNTLYFSPSDFCKPSEIRGKSRLYGIEGITVNVVELIKCSLSKQVEELTLAVDKVNYALDIIHTQKHNATIECFNTEGYGYNLVMDAYMELGNKLTPILKYLLKEGYNIIADRWMMSTLAYNYLVKKTYMSTMVKYGLKSKKANTTSIDQVLLLKGTHYKDGLCEDNYICIMNYIHNHLKDILVPDILIYLQENLPDVMNNIHSRGKASIFEHEDKLLRVDNMFYALIKTHGMKDAILDIGKNLLEIHNVLFKGEDVVHEKVYKYLLETLGEDYVNIKDK